MSSDPLDTRVTNGRFVGPGAPAEGVLTIHGGRIVDAPAQDVWRTVNASGHFVLPGLIQATGVSSDTALEAVRGGVTTALTEDRTYADACIDFASTSPGSLEVIEMDHNGALTDAAWNRLLSEAPVHLQAPADAPFPLIHFLYQEGHVARGMTLERIAALTSGNVAAASGIFPQKGCLSVGSDGDLFVFDPDADDPYSDIAWPGRVIFSLLRGSILLYNGQIHTRAGDGKRLG